MTTQVKINAKAECLTKMNAIFEMIGDIPDITTGAYVQIAELFKELGVNLDILVELNTEIKKNTYYQQHLSLVERKKRQALSEDEKRKHKDWVLCECKQYIHKNSKKEHEETQKHSQAMRNLNFTAKKASHQIDKEVNTHIALTAFCIKHVENIV